MRWRYRNSAVANRHALRSDYYSTTKKTANPLNEWWTTTQPRDAPSALRFAHPRVRNANDVSTRAPQSRFSPHKRNACATGISATLRQMRGDRAQLLAIVAARPRRGDDPLRGVPRGAQKNFPPAGPIGRCADQKSRRQQRISAK
jgi:hypothetical protein